MGISDVVTIMVWIRAHQGHLPMNMVGDTRLELMTSSV